jgi:hypothetical protein
VDTGGLSVLYRRSMPLGHVDTSLIPPGRWALPARIIVTKTQVKYQLHAFGEGAGALHAPAAAEASGALLDAIGTLDVGDTAAMQALTAQWGPLELCGAHGLPVTHTFPATFHADHRLWAWHEQVGARPCPPRQWTDARGKTWRSDPISVEGVTPDGGRRLTGGWRRLVAEAQALAALAELLATGGGEKHPERSPAAVAAAAVLDDSFTLDPRTAFSFGLQRWAKWAQLRPWWHFVGREGRGPLQEELFPETLVGGIVLAIVQLHRHSTGRATVPCAGCREPHWPVNPRPNTESYCPSCRSAGVPRRRADSRYRERKRRGVEPGTRGGNRLPD